MKKYLKNIFLYSSSLYVFVIALIRAYTAAFTYDEVYTHDYYVLAMDFFNIDVIKAIFAPDYCLANNHLLNSFLMKLFEDLTGIYYSELILRLPNLMFFAVLLLFLIYCVQKGLISLLAYSSFIFLYYLNDFFSTARGYGMCVCLLFFALTMFDQAAQTQFKNYKYITLSLLFFVLAISANTLALLITAPFGLFCLIRLIQNKTLPDYLKRHCFFWLPLCVMILLLTKYHFMVTGNGKPTHMTNQNFFSVLFIDFTSKYMSNGFLIISISVLLLLSSFITLLLVKKKIWTLSYQIPFIFFLITLILVSQIFDFLPYGRAMLPMYPLLILMFFENLKIWKQKLNIVIENRFSNSVHRPVSLLLSVIQCFIVVALFLNFTRQINFYVIQEWPKYSENKKIAYHTLFSRTSGNDEVINASYPMSWYRDKIVLEFGYDILDE